jgi:hypothetical protein
MTVQTPAAHSVQIAPSSGQPQPDGYRIVHTFQHQSTDTGTEEELTEQTIETVDVTSWDDICRVLDDLFLHTGSGYTLSVRVTALYGPANAWRLTPEDGHDATCACGARNAA